FLMLGITHLILVRRARFDSAARTRLEVEWFFDGRPLAEVNLGEAPTLLIDGHPWNGEIRVPYGNVSLSVQDARFRPWRTNAQIAYGQISRLTVDLEYPRAFLEAWSDPAGATVLVNGLEIGKTPTQ